MKLKCVHCGKVIHRKPSRIKKLKLAFCDNVCWKNHLANHPIEQKKAILILRHKNGEMIKDLAKEIMVLPATLGYHFKKWGVKTKRSYEYGEVLKVINNISKQRSIESKKNFLTNYKNGKISWRTAHNVASDVWKITKSPCRVCGWDKAERDMHLLIPRLLEKENAVSLCPNCHRLFHRKILTKNQLKI